MIKDKLQEIIDYFDMREDWSLKELTEEVFNDTELLGNIALDELDICWGEDEHIINLEQFLKEYTNQLLNRVCNVVKSFQKEIK